MKRAKLFLAGLVGLATFIVYLPALWNDFVHWDDGSYVFDNLHIRSLGADFFQWAFLNFHASNWHPLTWISHALDYALWGLNPVGHHLTSVVIHAVNAFLVVLLALRLIEARRDEAIEDGTNFFLDEPGVLITAGITGLLFGIHPLHVESVAWAAERKDVLCALFFLLSIMMYAKAAWGMEHGAEGKKSRASTPCAMHHALFADKHYLAALGFFLLALLSKPMAISLPVVLLILDWHPYNRIHSLRNFRRACIEKIPFIALSAASAVMTILAQRSGEALRTNEFASLSARILVATKSLVAYLIKMVWPFNLVPFYPYPKEASLSSWEYLVPLLIAVAITAACIGMMKRRKIWPAIWAYYVATLIPVLGLVQVGNQAMADRYTYLPSLGPFLLLGLAASSASKKISFARSRTFSRAVAAGCLVLILVFLSTLTINQIGRWRTSQVLWDYIVQKEPDVSIVHYYRGTAFWKSGLRKEALKDLDTAISLDPLADNAYFIRGTIYGEAGRYDKAIEDFTTAIRLYPSYYEAYINRGIAFKTMGAINKAITDFQNAIEMQPFNPTAYYYLGGVYSDAGELDKAMEFLNKSLSLDPLNAAAYEKRAIASAYAGRFDRALDDFNKAIELKKDNPSLYFNRGSLFRKMGNDQGALSDFRKACELGDTIACASMKSN